MAARANLRRVWASLEAIGWRRWRQAFLLFLLFTFTVVFIGSSTNMSGEEGSKIREEVGRSIAGKANPPGIFTNNFAVALLLLTPGIGPLIGAVILHNTGVVIAATGVSANIPSILIMLGLLLLPFTWLEFIAYSAAMTQSVFLTVGLLRRGLRRELARTGVVVLVVMVTLALAALVEASFITLS